MGERIDIISNNFTDLFDINNDVGCSIFINPGDQPIKGIKYCGNSITNPPIVSEFDFEKDGNKVVISKDPDNFYQYLNLRETSSGNKCFTYIGGRMTMSEKKMKPIMIFMLGADNNINDPECNTDGENTANNILDNNQYPLPSPAPTCDNPDSTNTNPDQTVKLVLNNEDEISSIESGCSVIHSYNQNQDSTATNYGTALKICNKYNISRPPGLGAIDKNNFCYNTTSATKDKYKFVSITTSENGNKCIRTVHLTDDMSAADTSIDVIFNGDCDTSVDHNAIINPNYDQFTNLKSSKKSKEHFESNKNLKCKHRY